MIRKFQYEVFGIMNTSIFPMSSFHYNWYLWKLCLEDHQRKCPTQITTTPVTSFTLSIWNKLCKVDCSGAGMSLYRPSFYRWYLNRAALFTEKSVTRAIMHTPIEFVFIDRSVLESCLLKQGVRDRRNSALLIFQAEPLNVSRSFWDQLNDCLITWRNLSLREMPKPAAMIRE